MSGSNDLREIYTKYVKEIRIKFASDLMSVLDRKISPLPEADFSATGITVDKSSKDVYWSKPPGKPLRVSLHRVRDSCCYLDMSGGARKLYHHANEPESVMLSRCLKELVEHSENYPCGTVAPPEQAPKVFYVDSVIGRTSLLPYLTGVFKIMLFYYTITCKDERSEEDLWYLKFASLQSMGDPNSVTAVFQHEKIDAKTIIGQKVGKISVSKYNKVIIRESGEESEDTVIVEGKYTEGRAIVKRIKKGHIDDVGDAVWNEIRNLHRCDEKSNVIGFYGWEVDEHFFYLAFEYCDRNLRDFIFSLYEETNEDSNQREMDKKQRTEMEEKLLIEMEEKRRTEMDAEKRITKMDAEKQRTEMEENRIKEMKEKRKNENDEKKRTGTMQKLISEIVDRLISQHREYRKMAEKLRTETALKLIREIVDPHISEDREDLAMEEKRRTEMGQKTETALKLIREIVDPHISQNPEDLEMVKKRTIEIEKKTETVLKLIREIVDRDISQYRKDHELAEEKQRTEMEEEKQRTEMEEEEKEKLLTKMEEKDKPLIQREEDRRIDIAKRTKTVVKLIREIVNGVARLHKLQIIHGDLKPHNILIGEENKVRIFSMGNSRHCPTADISSLNNKSTTCCVSFEADMFDLGQLLQLFVESKDSKYVPVQENIKYEALDLIRKLSEKDQKSRPTALQAKNHPLLWDPSKKLEFLRAASDHLQGNYKAIAREKKEEEERKLEERKLEQENKKGAKNKEVAENKEVATKEDTDKEKTKEIPIEDIALEVFGKEWEERLNRDFVDEMEFDGKRYFNYTYTEMYYLLRFIRDLKNHDEKIKVQLNPNDHRLDETRKKKVLKIIKPGETESYFFEKYPKLVMEVYNLMKEHCAEDDNNIHNYYFK